MFGTNYSSMEAFERQFDGKGDTLVYRRSEIGNPVRVTEAEKSVFVQEYVRSIRRLVSGVIVVWTLLTLALVLGSVMLNVDTDGSTITVGTVAIILLVTVLYTIILMRQYHKPWRTLQHRQPVGPAMSKDEAAAYKLSKVTWPRLAAVVPVAALIGFSHWSDQGVERWIWLGMAGGLVIVGIVQAIRKLRSEWRKL